jgi:hypothetical protein
VTVGASSAVRAVPVAGDVVVLDVDGTAPLRAVVSKLRSRGLALVPLSSLLESTSGRPARAIVSRDHPRSRDVPDRHEARPGAGVGRLSARVTRPAAVTGAGGRVRRRSPAGR